MDAGENQPHTTDGISLEFGWREHGGSELERKERESITIAKVKNRR
jgi:hypothetical protein